MAETAKDVLDETRRQIDELRCKMKDRVDQLNESMTRIASGEVPLGSAERKTRSATASAGLDKDSFFAALGTLSSIVLDTAMFVTDAVELSVKHSHKM
jgi:hypothetical protein